MDIQRELKNDLTSIKGAIETQEGIYIPLKEVDRMLINRIQQVKNNDLLHDVMLGLEGRELFPDQIERAKRFFSMLGEEIDEA